MSVLSRPARLAGTVCLCSALLAMGFASAGGNGYPRPGRAQRVTPRAVTAAVPAISGNGRFVVFQSNSRALSRDLCIEEGETCPTELYVFDRQTNRIERVSVSSAGVSARHAGPNPNLFSAISNNGRYVAFSTDAHNLGSDGVGNGSCIVACDTNKLIDIYLRDRKKGSTTRVSVGVDPEGNPTRLLRETDGHSTNPAISNSGRYIVFESTASNLVADDDNQRSDVFLYDRATGKLIAVSDLDRAESAFIQPSISPEGRYIAYVGRDTGILLWDRITRKTKLVSVSSDGSPARGDQPEVSAGGQYVTFQSPDSNLIPNDTNRPPNPTGNLGNGVDVFVRDIKKRRTERISVTYYGGQLEPSAVIRVGGMTIGTGLTSGMPSISAAGRYVAFESNADRLLPYDSVPLVHVYDRATGAVEAAPMAKDGGRPNRPSHSPEISDGGRFIALTSLATNLVRGGGRAPSVYLYDRGSAVGAGGWGSRGRPWPDPEQCNDALCPPPICVSDLCLPPSGTLAAGDPSRDLDELNAARGADLIEARLAYRPQFQDLFFDLELKEMPPVHVGAISPSKPGVAHLLYGVRFAIDDRRYELRVARGAFTSASPVFGLFDCTDSPPLCTEVARVRGGYGTTGAAVVASLPLERVGLENGGRLKHVRAFTATGTYEGGAIEILDVVRVRR